MMNAKHGQRFVPLGLPLLAELNGHRCISVAVALDIPSKAKVLDGSRIDDEPLRHDLVHLRPDWKSDERFVLSSRLSGKNNEHHKGENSRLGHESLYLIRCFHSADHFIEPEPMT